jgi:hypothetical protein
LSWTGRTCASSAEDARTSRATSSDDRRPGSFSDGANGASRIEGLSRCVPFPHFGVWNEGTPTQPADSSPIRPRKPAGDAAEWSQTRADREDPCKRDAPRGNARKDRLWAHVAWREKRRLASGTSVAQLTKRKRGLP